MVATAQKRFHCLTASVADVHAAQKLAYKKYIGPAQQSRGGGGVKYISPFWEETARKQPLPGTYLTNSLVKGDELGANLPTM